HRAYDGLLAFGIEGHELIHFDQVLAIVEIAEQLHLKRGALIWVHSFQHAPPCVELPLNSRGLLVRHRVVELDFSPLFFLAERRSASGDPLIVGAVVSGDLQVVAPRQGRPVPPAADPIRLVVEVHDESVAVHEDRATSDDYDILSAGLWIWSRERIDGGATVDQTVDRFLELLSGATQRLEQDVRVSRQAQARPW